MLRGIGTKLCDKSGSTLLEAVVSLALFTFIMIMTVSAFSVSGVITTQSQDLDTATNDAMRRLAEDAPDGASQDYEIVFTDSSHTSYTVEAKLVGQSGGGVTFWKFLDEAGGPGA